MTGLPPLVIPDPTRMLFRGHKNYVLNVAFSIDGKLIVSKSDDDTERTWDVYTGREIGCVKKPAYFMRSIAFSPNGKLIVPIPHDNTVQILSLETRKTTIFLKGHMDLVFQVIFSPCGRMIVSGSRDCTVRIWNVETGEEIKKLEGYRREVCCVALSPNGRKLTVSTHNDPSEHNKYTFTVLDFGGPNLGTLSPEEVELYI